MDAQDYVNLIQHQCPIVDADVLNNLKKEVICDFSSLLSKMGKGYSSDYKLILDKIQFINFIPSCISSLRFPVYIGLLPSNKKAKEITIEYLNKSEGKFVDFNKIITEYLNFKDTSLKNIFIMVPSAYPDLVSMTNDMQKFTIEAFDVTENIPLLINNKAILYKAFVYKQSLATLDQEITFNFIN